MGGMGAGLGGFAGGLGLAALLGSGGRHNHGYSRPDHYDRDDTDVVIENYYGGDSYGDDSYDPGEPVDTQSTADPVPYQESSSNVGEVDFEID